MKIALIGHGAMGKLIGRLAVEKGHEIAVICESPHVSKGDTPDAPVSPLLTRGLPQRDALAVCDVAIDFTVADAVQRNVEACVAAGVPLVEGTTGWNSERDEIERIVREGNGAFVFGANFSIGVNLFYRIADFAAELFAKFPEYEVFIEEQHHSRKKDAPSGTALKLKEIVGSRLEESSPQGRRADEGVRVPKGRRADEGVRVPKGRRADEGVRVPISSTRAGNIPGTHRVGFDGPADQILLKHTARSREGFAHGALIAAEWIVGKKGFYEFTAVMDEIIKS